MQTLPIKLMQAALICCLLLYLGSHKAKDFLFLNLSKSMERGFYVAIEKDSLEVGDLVVIAIPSQVRGWSPHKESLLKRIVGKVGDKACYSDSKVLVNGREFTVLNYDCKGERLPRQRNGCRKLLQNEFFVAGDSKDSFDSRYFGVVEDTEIRAVVRPLW